MDRIAEHCPGEVPKVKSVLDSLYIGKQKEQLVACAVPYCIKEPDETELPTFKECRRQYKAGKFIGLAVTAGLSSVDEICAMTKYPTVYVKNNLRQMGLKLPDSPTLS